MALNDLVFPCHPSRIALNYQQVTSVKAVPFAAIKAFFSMSKPRYDTVLERCSPTTETVLLSFICKHTLNSDHVFGTEMTSDRMDEITEAMEAVVSGRKYEVLLLRSQGKSMAEIAMLLAISKSTVQNYYRQAIRQVRQALGVEKSDPEKRKTRKAVVDQPAASVPA